MTLKGNTPTLKLKIITFTLKIICFIVIIMTKTHNHDFITFIYDFKVKIEFYP